MVQIALVANEVQTWRALLVHHVRQKRIPCRSNCADGARGVVQWTVWLPCAPERNFCAEKLPNVLTFGSFATQEMPAWQISVRSKSLDFSNFTSQNFYAGHVFKWRGLKRQLHGRRMSRLILRIVEKVRSRVLCSPVCAECEWHNCKKYHQFRPALRATNAGEITDIRANSNMECIGYSWRPSAQVMMLKFSVSLSRAIK